MALQIEIVSDVVCPWCFIGKRRLEQALGRAPDTPVSLRWRPFQLNPQLPAGGVERAEYVRAKFGARATEIYDRVARVGRGVGIDFAFDRIVRQPNTLPAHQLIGAAAVAGVEEAMVETLFRAYFLEGADLTSRACLLGLAARAGLASSDAQLALDDTQLRQAVLYEERSAHSLGIEGVPFFIFGGRVGVSGAQEVDVLVAAIEQASSAESDLKA
jgi:predicted DsbA family dithiol-disulfide isomerase